MAAAMALLLLSQAEAAAQSKPAEFIDARLLTEIDKSGYIDKLYAGQAK